MLRDLKNRTSHVQTFPCGPAGPESMVLVQTCFVATAPRCFAPPVCATSVSNPFLPIPDCEYITTTTRKKKKKKKLNPLLNHIRIQYQNPVNALIWKNRINLPGNKEVKMLRSSFLLCIALKKRNDRSQACARSESAHAAALSHSFNTHTLTHTHTYTQNSDVTHCCSGGILPVFWF